MSEPTSPECERAVLGAALISPDAAVNAASKLCPDDFFTPPGLPASPNERIYRAIRELGRAADTVTVSELLKTNGELELIPGGAAYVAGLTDGVPRSSSVMEYGARLQDLTQRRREIRAAERYAEAAGDLTINGERKRYLADLIEASRGLPGLRRAVDLADPSIVALRPPFRVERLVREKGLHVVHAPGGGGKTHLLLHLIQSLMLDPLPSHLYGHTDLEIRSGFRRALWISVEEDAAALKYKAAAVARGLGTELEPGRLLFLFAPAKPRITLAHIAEIVEQEGPLDALAIDSVTAMFPRQTGGRSWDSDPSLVSDAMSELRGISESSGLGIFMSHHTPKSDAGEARGPAAWRDGADVYLGIRRVSGSDLRAVTLGKARDSADLDTFHIAPAWNADGSFTVSLAEAGNTTSALTPAQAEILGWMQNTGPVSQTDALVAASRKKISGKKISDSTFWEAMRVLKARGHISETGQMDGRSPILTVGSRDVK